MHHLILTCSAGDEHLIKEAPPRQLLRMRKDFLVHLYATASLPDDAEFLTKQEIVDAIVAAREEVSEPPMSSSPSRLVSSRNGSSDDGNVAGDEQTDFGVGIRAGLGALRRRATANDAMRTNHRVSPNRSVSLGNIPPRTSTESRKRPRTLEQNGRSGSAGR
jgi:mitogen-activated protein kinase kinase kinase 13